MITTIYHRVDAQRAREVSQRMLSVLQQTPHVEAELALLMAYCDLADGVRTFPLATRAARVRLVTMAASRAVCDIIAKVGALPDCELARVAREMEPS